MKVKRAHRDVAYGITVWFLVMLVNCYGDSKNSNNPYSRISPWGRQLKPAAIYISKRINISGVRNRRVTSWKETTERFVGLTACWHHSRTSTPPSRKLRDAVKTGSGSANENDVPGRERTVSVGMLRSARVDDGERNHHWPWLGKKVWSMGN